VRRSLLAMVVVASALGGCGGSSSVSPNPVPTNAAPTPTQTAAPAEDPLIACTPAPPPIYGFIVKIHDDLGYKKILDSRGLVQDITYCTAVGYPNYNICVVRDEMDPQAVTCNNRLTGKAEDTGRYGPTWFWNGQPCRPIQDPASGPGCKNHPTNQFMLFAFGPGEYMACAEGRRGCKTLTIQ
jgi:hypothetical protein